MLHLLLYFEHTVTWVISTRSKKENSPLLGVWRIWLLYLAVLAFKFRHLRWGKSFREILATRETIHFQLIALREEISKCPD